MSAVAVDTELVADLLAPPLDELCAEARRRRPGGLVTYSPKVFVPLTTLCRDVCGTARSRARRGGVPRSPFHD